MDWKHIRLANFSVMLSFLDEMSVRDCGLSLTIKTKTDYLRQKKNKQILNCVLSLESFEMCNSRNNPCKRVVHRCGLSRKVLGLLLLVSVWVLSSCSLVGS